MTSEEEVPLPERYLPTYETIETCGIVVEASPEATWAAVLRADLGRSALLRAALELRSVPNRLRAAQAKRPVKETGPGLTLEDVARAGYVRLAERPGHELVLGTITQPWKAAATGTPSPPAGPDEFVAFDDPGHVKSILSIRVEAYASGHSLLTTETRVLATDPASRRRFVRYWIASGPTGALVRRLALRIVKEEAES